MSHETYITIHLVNWNGYFNSYWMLPKCCVRILVNYNRESGKPPVYGFDDNDNQHEGILIEKSNDPWIG